MDETHPTDLADLVGYQHQLTDVRQRVQQDIDQYLAQRDHQHALAQAHLSADPAKFSDAATACHYAHQFQRQAETLAWVKLALR